MHTLGTYQLLVMKSHLPDRHRPILLQIRPWRVDDRHIIPFVSCAQKEIYQQKLLQSGSRLITAQHCPSLPQPGKYKKTKCSLPQPPPDVSFCQGGKTTDRAQRVNLTANIPSIEFAFVSCAQSSSKSFGNWSQTWPSCSRR